MYQTDFVIDQEAIAANFPTIPQATIAALWSSGQLGQVTESNGRHTVPIDGARRLLTALTPTFTAQREQQEQQQQQSDIDELRAKVAEAKQRAERGGHSEIAYYMSCKRKLQQATQAAPEIDRQALKSQLDALSAERSDYVAGDVTLAQLASRYPNSPTSNHRQRTEHVVRLSRKITAMRDQLNQE